jgi:hypothetical protein
VTIQLLTINLNNLDGLKRSCDSVIEFCTARKINVKWLIKDGVSKDGSIEYLESLKLKKLPENLELTILILSDSGIFNGMNQAIDHSEDNMLSLFLNSGDIISKEFIIEFDSQKFRDFDIVYGDYFTNVEDNKFRIKSDPNLDLSFVLSKMINHQSIFINSKLLKKYLFKEEFWVNADWIQLFEIIKFNELKINYLGFAVSVYELGGNSGKFYNEGIEQRKRYLASQYTSNEINLFTNVARLRQRPWYHFLIKSLDSPKRSILLTWLSKLLK